MTREDAWRRTKGYLYDVLSGEEADEIIKALEQQPCGDCISRKAATDRFDLVQSDDKCMGYDDIMQFLLSLPSVEPERKTGKWIPIRFKSPQQGQRVFISTIKGTIHDEIWDMNRIYNYATDGCWYRNWFVVAWMPFFIEPYKAGSDDRNEI